MKTFWRILKLLGDYKWLTILGFALAFTQMGLGLVVPRIIQLTINNALIGGETGLLVTYGLALLGIAVVRFVVGVGRRLASGKASLGIEYDLRNRMWTHILRQSFSYFDRWPTGQLMSRAMSDVQNVRMFLGLRPHLLRHQHRDDGRHRRDPPRHGLAAGAACRWRSCRSCCW